MDLYIYEQETGVCMCCTVIISLYVYLQNGKNNESKKRFPTGSVTATLVCTDFSS